MATEKKNGWRIYRDVDCKTYPGLYDILDREGFFVDVNRNQLVGYGVGLNDYRDLVFSAVAVFYNKQGKPVMGVFNDENDHNEGFRNSVCFGKDFTGQMAVNMAEYGSFFLPSVELLKALADFGRSTEGRDFGLREVPFMSDIELFTRALKNKGNWKKLFEVRDTVINGILWPEEWERERERIFSESQQERFKKGYFVNVKEIKDCPKEVLSSLDTIHLHGFNQIEGVNLPSLKEIVVHGDGKLMIYDNVDFPSLKTVTGKVVEISNWNVNLPKLSTVNGDLAIYAGQSLPGLMSVSGNLKAFDMVSCPQLSKVGGKARIGERCSFPMMKATGGIFANKRRQRGFSV